MNCIEASEFISAFRDGETIPQEAAKHIAGCADCQRILDQYSAIGVELRRIATLEMASGSAVRPWKQRRNVFVQGWKSAWQAMRIPRLAFATLVLCLVAVAARLAVVEVGARSIGNAVRIDVDFGLGASTPCYLQAGGGKARDCSSGASSRDGERFASYAIFLRQFDGARFLLELRALVLHADAHGRIASVPILSQPARQLWFTPGQRLEVPLENGEKLTLTGEWIDRVPSFLAQAGTPKIDPEGNELRLESPLLVRDAAVAGDLEGFACRSFGAWPAARLVFPQAGRLTLALESFPGATVATVKGSRLLFSSGGRRYALVNGVPIARADTLWVLYEPGVMRAAEAGNTPIACGSARALGLSTRASSPVQSAPRSGER